MEPFQYIGRYFWAICLVIAVIHYLKAERNAKANSVGTPEHNELGKHYRRIVAIFSVTPWLIMGLGQLAGSTPNVWYYFRPQDGNPFVVAWVGFIIAQSVVFAIWVFAAEGARKVRDFDLMSVAGMRTQKPTSEIAIKLIAAGGPVFVAFWVYLVMSSNVSIPR